MTRRRQLAAAAAVAVVMLLLYRATLLPGFDFGDTGAFQTAVASPHISLRDAYPLYFALGKLLLWITGAEPARALNLASAVEAALACGVIALVAAEIGGSLAAAIGVAMLFA